MKKGNIEFAILVNGKPVREFGHNGDVYVEGREGSNFELQIKNNNSYRVMVIPSVDGVNVLTGKEAINDDNGYVVAAFSSLNIPGWRTSLEKVAKFIFNKKEESYAKDTTGSSKNCGVLGIMAFAEKVKEAVWMQNTKEYHYYHYPCYQPFYPSYPCYQPFYPSYPYTYWTTPTSINDGSYTTNINTANINTMNNSLMGNTPSDMTSMSFVCSIGGGTSCSSAPVASSVNYMTQSTDNYSIGTGWGKEADSVVTETSFEKGTLLDTFEVFYSTLNGLKSLGVDITKQVKVAFDNKPKAFGRFCSPPKN